MTHEETKTWLGSSILDICNNKEVWSFNVPPINISKYHAVLFKLPVTLKDPPVPFKNSDPRHWDDDHVRMPYSDKNLFPVTENGVDVIKLRWKLIKENLHRPINNSKELEAAIHAYNSPLPPFNALHNYFDEMEEDITEHFFKGLLPKIISLALNLPHILPGSLPLLKQNHNRSVSLSQYQVASLLANAFLCTFPWRKDTKYPGVNFVSLFIADQRPKRQNCIYEKFKCIFNYFRMVTSSIPLGVITFERKYIHKSDMLRWDTCDLKLNQTKVHIDSAGTIEENGLGFLQVDFANRNVGGGVLRYGCVQEEIRFAICPELIIARLFVEQLNDFEAVLITGVQRYSNYSGYGDTFTWESTYNDPTPHDEYGRIRTSVLVIDATHYGKESQQFYPSAMLREVNKAYVGFSARDKTNLSPVATGNWGCGAFNGSLHLKSLLQLMACTAAGRHLVYYTFSNEEFRNEFYEMFIFLATNNVTIKQLWRFLCNFCDSRKSGDKLYAYIQQAFFDSKKQPSVKTFFKKDPGPSSSVKSKDIDTKTVQSKEFYTKNKARHLSEQDLDIVLNNAVIEDLFGEELKCPDENSIKKIKTNNVSKLSQEQIKHKLPRTDVGDLIDEMDTSSSRKTHKDYDADSLLEEIDKLSRDSKKCDSRETSTSENMEIDSDSASVDAKIKKKISDYFSKIT